jgi:hypothetical protein
MVLLNHYHLEVVVFSGLKVRLRLQPPEESPAYSRLKSAEAPRKISFAAPGLLLPSS